MTALGILLLLAAVVVATIIEGAREP